MSTDLRLMAIGAITHRLLVPAYQRGYRWGAPEVTALLDDIASIREKDDEDYCLQPVVVRKTTDGVFEVIDGQQRLTTLYLLFLYMQREGFKRSAPPFSIAYATRPASAAFLANIEPKRADENIDFFHLAGAFGCIKDWFSAEAQPELIADDVYRHLHRRVKVIWYEVAADVDATALFARLNVGRIPLTNAELVKALLLRRTGEGGSQVRATEIAMQWDAIERELRDEGLWAFVTNRTPVETPTRIELLLDSMVDGGRGDSLRTFHHFKARLDAGERVADVWNDVLARMDLVKGWYEDRELYHRIGYLIATGTRDDDLRALVRESSSMTKSQFSAGLDVKIMARLNLSTDRIAELSYQRDREACHRALLLFNVLSVSRTVDSFERYPFHAHKGNRWSLEHIHAQNSDALVKKEQWQSWLADHRDALAALQKVGTTPEITGLVGAIGAGLVDVTRESFAALAGRVHKAFEERGEGDDMHGMENLALLPQEANSKLNNAVFEVKRRRILELDRRGQYIPICTRRVFLKYYTEAASQQLHLWSKADRAAYLDAMLSPVVGLGQYLRAGQ